MEEERNKDEVTGEDTIRYYHEEDEEYPEHEIEIGTKGGMAVPPPDNFERTEDIEGTLGDVGVPVEVDLDEEEEVREGLVGRIGGRLTGEYEEEEESFVERPGIDEEYTTSEPIDMPENTGD